MTTDPTSDVFRYCGIPISIQNTAWDVQDGDGIGIYKQMHMKCHSFVQRGSGRFLCLENGTWKSDLACQVISIDCKDLRDNGQTNSGVYVLYPFGTSSRPVRVYCDMYTMDGGWTGIQKRVDGSLSFDRTWTEYKKGFGDPEQDVWIGNDVIHLLTKGKNSSLYISITLVDGNTLYALYDQFSVSSEEDKYRLFLAGFFDGSLGDSMLNTGDPSHDLSGMYFSTPERDNDRFTRGSCASICKGGWWFNNCYAAFLNGVMSGFWTSPWTPTVRVGSSVKETIMMIKRH